MLRIYEDLTLTDNHIAYATSQTLRHLNILNKSWITVKRKCGKHRKSLTDKFNALEENKTCFVLKLTKTSCNDLSLIFDDNDDDLASESNTNQYEHNVLYVSASSLYNIAERDPRVYQDLQRNCEVHIDILKDFDDQRKTYFANTVEISPVSCAFGSISEDCLNQVIKDYFTEPKILQNKELFSLKLDKKCLKVKGRPCLLWFQVKSLDQSPDGISHLNTNALFVNDCHSNLYLSNPVNCFIPLCPCFLQNNPQLVDLYRDKDFEEAFQKYFSKLHELFDVVFSKNISAHEALLLLEGHRGIGKGLLIRCLCYRKCVHFLEENCFDLIGESLSATEKRLSNLFQLVTSTSPCVLYLKNVHLLCKDKEGLHEERRILHYFMNLLNELNTTDHPVMVVGSTTCSKDISSRFFAEFIHHVEIDTPNENERSNLLQALQYTVPNKNTNNTELAKKTAGFILSDFVSLINKIHLKKDAGIHMELFEQCIEEIRSLKAGSSDTVKIPKVTWNDVGGLQNVKNDIMDTLELPLKFPGLFSNGLQRSGLLFFGPPGCGKTLLAKAVANELTLNFYSVKGPELINMYVGQSEENVREVFSKARSMSPCVIFFDEIDSLAPNRGRSGDSGGVMDRVVSQLLAELDGMHDNTDIFVIGATNRPDLLDPSLLRPGRFDKIIYVGIPEAHLERLNIMKAVSRKLKLSPDVNLEEIVKTCPLNLTGADFYALASRATMNCFRRLITAHEQHGIALRPDGVEVSTTDFQQAIECINPSVSLDELQRYHSIREELFVKNKQNKTQS